MMVGKMIDDNFNYHLSVIICLLIVPFKVLDTNNRK
jgi:hypothetical protein